MIDWLQQARLLAALIDDAGDPTAVARVRAAESAAPRFRNIDYPFTPMPLLVDPGRVAAMQAQVEAYVALLEKTIRFYRTQPEVRAYFGLGDTAEALVATDDGLPRQIAICRLDGYMRQDDGSLCVLENNSDCPAGPLFTQRLDALVDQAIAPTLGRLGLAVRALPGDAAGAVHRVLLEGYRAWGGQAMTPRIGILQLAGRGNVESDEMAAELRSLGVAAAVIDPRVVRFTARGVEHDGEVVDLVWNKINTASFRGVAVEHPDVITGWRDAIEARAICHLNGFGARYVTENKLCAAFLQEESFAALLDEDERALVAALLPWSRKVERNKRVRYDGGEHDLIELLRERQVEFVLKQHYDIRGDGVTIGRAVDRATWDAAVEAARASGHTAQAFVRPVHLPVLRDTGGRAVSSMPVSLDSFVFHGRLAMMGSKASFHDKLNLFQGGRKLAVRIVDRFEAA
jgi:hypothetical protein